LNIITINNETVEIVSVKPTPQQQPQTIPRVTHSHLATPKE
jgi:hypothetical protein